MHLDAFPGCPDLVVLGGAAVQHKAGVQGVQDQLKEKVLTEDSPEDQNFPCKNSFKLHNICPDLPR